MSGNAKTDTAIDGNVVVSRALLPVFNIGHIWKRIVMVERPFEGKVH